MYVPSSSRVHICVCVTNSQITFILVFYFGFDSKYCVFVCYGSRTDEEVPSTPDRGLLHIWQSAGPSAQLCPERVLLSMPVLQAALGEHHGLLLTQGESNKQG